MNEGSKMKDMKRMIPVLFAAALVILPSSSWAQDKPATSMWQAPFPDHNIPMTAEGEVVTAPICFRVINRADYTITGSLYTNYYVNNKGQKARHTSNFRLEAGQSQPYCSYGPFYDGQRLSLVLRTVLPIFECQTRIDGDIYLMGKVNDDGTRKTWAICLDTPQPGSLR